MKFDVKTNFKKPAIYKTFSKNESSDRIWNKRQYFFKVKKLKIFLLVISIISIYYFASYISGFKDILVIAKLPLGLFWLIKNFIPNGESLKYLPLILKTLGKTCAIAISATIAASFFALILAVLGSKTTGINKTFKVIVLFVSSFLRNIPLVAWTMILLFSFKQNNFTGFLALFVITFGHLVRAFKEMIDESSKDIFNALRASGVPYFSAISNGVIPVIAPGIISWILYAIETNVRDSALIGILTGSGIGFLFNLYFKSFRYNSAGLIILVLVIAVLIIDFASNKIRQELL